jgi:hypothetical protein
MVGASAVTAVAVRVTPAVVTGAVRDDLAVAVATL